MKKYKYILLIIVTFVLFFSIIVYASIKGDVDGKNGVDNKDYVLVRNHILKKKLLTGDELKRADVDGINGIDNRDYALIRNIIIEESLKSSYTVTFDSSGGSKVDNQIVKEKGKAISPTNPTRSGYTFIEWQLNGKTYDFNSEVTNNIKLVAIWIKFDKTKYSMKTNDKNQIKYTINPSTNGVNITYSSNDKSIVTVDKNGNINAIGAGNTSIIVKANNKSVGTIENIIDYSFFDTCNIDKKSTKVSVNTDKGKNINIYSCLENQDWTHQSFAVTDDSIIYSKPTYRAWCQSGSQYEVPKYNLKGDCDSKGYGVLVLTSSNSFRKYDRKTGKFVINYLDVAGHGQAFDATSNNEIYVNYFPKLISSKHGYGAHTTGVAYIKDFSSDKSYVNPNSILLLKNNGNITQYKSTYTVGTTEYNKDIISKAKEKDNMKSLELAVDEEHNRIAILDKIATSNGNLTLYIYKLSDFINGKKTLINTYYFKSSVCSGGYCGHQGIELYGNYLYSVHSLSISKIKYSTCSKTDKKDASCTSESIKIPNSKIGKEYGKSTTGINELEGLSVYKGKVYVSALTKKFSDGRRKNILLLLENF